MLGPIHQVGRDSPRPFPLGQGSGTEEAVGRSFRPWSPLVPTDVVSRSA